MQPTLRHNKSKINLGEINRLINLENTKPQTKLVEKLENGLPRVSLNKIVNSIYFTHETSNRFVVFSKVTMNIKFEYSENNT